MMVRSQPNGSAATGVLIRQSGRERQRHLLALIRERGHLNVSDATGEVGVSVETVRRDLNVLEQHGLIRRAYGMAYPVESVGFETDLAHRSSELVAETTPRASSSTRASCRPRSRPRCRTTAL
jgi:DeoR family fructose operon transcriptional repressor